MKSELMNPLAEEQEESIKTAFYHRFQTFIFL